MGLAAKRVGAYLNKEVSLSRLKEIALYYFNLRRHKSSLTRDVLKRLWRETYHEVLPILKDVYKLKNCKLPWNIRVWLERLERGAMLLDNAPTYLFQNQKKTSNIYSLHAKDVQAFNKNKLNKRLEFGRAYQLGRISGIFLFVGACDSLHMPDARSLKKMLHHHEILFGASNLDSISTDKGYYSYENERLLESMGVVSINLPRPRRVLDAPPPNANYEERQQLANRRSGIEGFISHVKHGGQMGRSRMKSDTSTLSAGYASVFGFNVRQLLRYVTGEVRPTLPNSTQNGKNLIPYEENFVY